MKLYLGRHGEARSADLDPEQHLTDRGGRNVRKVAGFLKRQELAVGAVRHSGKARAAETAELLAAGLASEDGVAEGKGLGPDDPVKPVKDEVGRASDDLMIVGHMPFLGKLASLLVAGNESAEVVAFDAGALVCLERADGGGTWRVLWAVSPGLFP